MTKNTIRDWIERKFDKLHKLTDKLPLGILDGVLHGTSRGIYNFLTDHHPEKMISDKPEQIYISEELHACSCQWQKEIRNERTWRVHFLNEF